MEGTRSGPSKTDIKTRKQLIAENEALRAALDVYECREPNESGSVFHSKLLKNLLAIFDSVPSAITLRALDGRYILVNRYAAETNGKRASEFVGRFPEDLLDKRVADELCALHRRVLETGGRTADVEGEFIDRPGQYYSRSAMPLREIGGEIEAVLTITRDVTSSHRLKMKIEEEREKAKRELERQNEFLHTVLDHIPSSIYLKDLKGRYVFVNKSAAERRKLPPAAFMGKTTADIYGPNQGPLLGGYTEHILATGESVLDVVSESHLILGNYFSYSGIPIRNENGKMTGVLNIVTDVSDKYRAERALEKERRRTALRLSAQNRFLQSVLNNVPAVIAIRDESLRYTFLNRGIESEKHTQSPNYIGNMLSQTFGAEYEDELDVLSARAMELDVPILNLERRVRGSDDGYRLTNIIPIEALADEVANDANPEFGDDSEPGGRLFEKRRNALIVSTDITDLKLAEAELARHRDQLAELVDERTLELQSAQIDLVRTERLAAIGQLTATVSHELRNPLGTIQSSFYAVRKRLAVDDKPVARAIARIDRSIERCTSIIEELLEYTRLRPALLKPVDVASWCDRILCEIEPPAGVAITSDICSGLQCDMDADRLAQAVINVLQNAWQAALEQHGETGEARVTLRARREDGPDRACAVIEVADNGTGILDDLKEQIFEPLFSTKIYGVGLGLALVKQIVDMHKGTIAVTDPPSGTGTVVAIRLPLEADVRFVS